LSITHYQQAQALNKISDPKVRQQKVTAGTKDAAAFQQAVTETAAPFYTNLVEDLTRCTDELGKLSAVLNQRCGADAPPTSSISGALTGCRDVIKDVARDKLQAAVAPAAPTAPGAAPKADAPAAEGQLRTRDDALKMLTKVADFFRQTEPHTPVSYAI